jgi:hypothetical protein
MVEALYSATRGERGKLPKLLGDCYIYSSVLDSIVYGVQGLLLARGQHSGFTTSPTSRIGCPINKDFILRWFEKLAPRDAYLRLQRSLEDFLRIGRKHFRPHAKSTRDCADLPGAIRRSLDLSSSRGAQFSVYSATQTLGSRIVRCSSPARNEFGHQAALHAFTCRSSALVSSQPTCGETKRHALLQSLRCGPSVPRSYFVSGSHCKRNRISSR